jgi:integrase
MRVGDAIRYDPVQCVKDEEENLWVYTFKPQKQKKAERQKDMEVYIPEQLKKAIDKCIWLSPTKPFYFGSPTSSSYLSGEVYNRMQTVGSRCGVSDCRPHRLRDTFAVRKLLAGLHLDDVSRLLGHSSVRITELYYARWVPARKARLRHLLAETLVDS